MILSAIVAASDNDVIGSNGHIPWRLPADNAYLRRVTNGKPLIMGSATHKSIGRILPGRANIVISRSPNYKGSSGAIVVSSLDKALALDEVKNVNEAIIFGGQSIYEVAMPRTDKIYLTRVHTVVEGDRFFKYNPDEWQETSKEEHKKDDQNQFDYDFIILERKG